MIVVEKKINALIDYVLASTQESRVKAMEQLRRLQFNETTGQPNVEAQVREILLRIGVPDSISGHGFLVTAIQMAVENPKIMLQKTKNSILRGISYTPASTARERNNQIGGHKK